MPSPASLALLLAVAANAGSFTPAFDGGVDARAALEEARRSAQVTPPLAFRATPAGFISQGPDGAADFPRTLTLNYNPAGVLPGQGPRVLLITFERDQDGRMRFVEGRSYLAGPLSVFRGRKQVGREDLKDDPELERLADAAADAYHKALDAVLFGPSHENNVDNGLGWAVSDSYALLTGDAGVQGTRYFYGRLKPAAGNLQGIQPLAETLAKFAARLRDR